MARQDFQLSEGLAEFYGALMGDGCLSRYNCKGKKKPVEVVLLTGNLVNDMDYYINTIRPIAVKEFQINGYLQERKKYNCVRYMIFSKKVFRFFENLNFPIGKKRELAINPLILSNNKNAIACVGGYLIRTGQFIGGTQNSIMVTRDFTIMQLYNLN